MTTNTLAYCSLWMKGVKGFYKRWPLMQSLFESALIKVPLSLFFAPIYLLIKFGHLIPEQRRVRVPFRSGLKINYANALAYFMETAQFIRH